MTINLKAPEKVVLTPIITVFGVGGAGGNAVNNMIAANLQGANFVVANTDAQALAHSLCENKIQLGATVTKGLGAGASSEVGALAAEESADEIRSYLEGSNMVFVTAGMGGGTGTGASPVVAKIAKEMGILTVGVVTRPFHFEGEHRMKTADKGIAELQQCVDTLIIITNQNLFSIANERTTVIEAFKMADDVLHAGVRGVTDLMIMPGLINLDFADIRSVMSEMGKAMMGTGEASGEDRAIKAAEAAISNPLLDHNSMKGARGVLINITGGDMTLFEVDAAASRIRKEVGHSQANIIFGSTFDPELKGVIRVSVVATGIEAESMKIPPKSHQTVENILNSSNVDLQHHQNEEKELVRPKVEEKIVANEHNIEASIQEKQYFQGLTQINDLKPAASTFEKENKLQNSSEKVSFLSKMWNSLKSPEKGAHVQPSVQDSSKHVFPQEGQGSQGDIQDIPAYLRKQK